MGQQAPLATHYKIKPILLNLLPNFHGRDNEDPYAHLTKFMDICSTVRIFHFTDDTLRLKLFPFSMKDRAKQWLNTLPPGSINTWEKCQQEFLRKYFPIGKTNQIRRSLVNFTQRDGESFHDTWDRLNELIRRCPHHEVPRWQLVQNFYYGLTEQHRYMIDASCGGMFLRKNEQ